ncbi:hypothetical protein [Trabulsiella odontotermitis]|uniref:hypothetical protein n=1 Tax=Trabulsiella odontotermitis TaxID=379893 RepID=UPI0006762F2C|nr:hypothetical protein [Trabulsiella odontotermitis]KNC88720.1 hypothetical protein GM30_10130 [Trabulsiella odontotermitis]
MGGAKSPDEITQSSNYVLAKYFDAFLQRTTHALREGVRDIETGSLRALVTMNSSPLVMDGYIGLKHKHLLLAYGDMIRAEDKRMIYAITSLITKRDIIYDMALTIVKFLFAKMPPGVKKDFTERYHEFESMITDIIAKQGIKAAAKIAIIELIVKLIAYRVSISPDVIISSRKIVAQMLTVIQIYSYFDKAAIAARQLRKDNRIIYDILYSQRIEMLYFLIADKIEPLITVYASTHSTNADELMIALADIINNR